MRITIQNEVQKLYKKVRIDELIYQRFIARLNDHTPLTHEQNSVNHFCCFTLPIDRSTQSIFLVHHIKARDWVPPGGHIDAGEIPIQTVRREFAEELDYKITREPIMLFYLSIKDIDNSNGLCRTHYDLWYTVETGKKQFKIDKEEFHDADWFSYDKAIKQIKTPLFKTIIEKFLF